MDANDDKKTEQWLLASLDRVTRILYDDKFRMTIADESPLEYTITNNYGEIVSADKEVRVEFLVTYAVMGFDEDADRGLLSKTSYKLNKEVAGDWVQLVTYREWILRAVRQDRERYLLVCCSLDAAQIGLQPLPGTTICWAWVPKAETKLEQTWSG